MRQHTALTVSMDRLQIGDLFRFAISGVVAYLYLLLSKPEIAKKLESATGTIGFPLVLIVAGSFIYYLYRPLVFDHFIRWFLNRISDGCTEYQQFLCKKLNVDQAEVDRLWRIIQERYPPKTEWQVRTAGIHMIYIGGILAIVFSIWCFSEGEPTKAFWFSIWGILCLSAAILNNVSYEREEFARLRSLPTADVESIVKNFLQTKKMASASSVESKTVTGGDT